jgi:alginate O-acetyltransferase complex protein AlgI
MVGWVFFRSENLRYALDFLQVMAGFSTAGGLQADAALHLTRKLVLALGLGVLFAVPWLPWIGQAKFAAWHELSALRATADLLLLGIFVLCAMSVAAGTYNPFIYFRF